MKYVDTIVDKINHALFPDLPGKSDGDERYARVISIILAFVSLILLVPMDIRLYALKIIFLLVFLLASFLNLHTILDRRFNAVSKDYAYISVGAVSLAFIVFIVRVSVILSFIA